jgi:serine/threonine-protein kinase RsbW
MGDSATTSQIPSTAVEIRCPSEYTVLSLIRLFISDVARQMGFEEDAVSEIELCVDEACANVIDHAYDASGGAAAERPGVEVILGIGADRLTVTVTDHGVGRAGRFESGTTDLAEYETREKPRGLGLYIINKLMDNVNLEFPADRGTRLTMTKIIPNSGRGAEAQAAS